MDTEKINSLVKNERVTAEVFENLSDLEKFELVKGKLKADTNRERLRKCALDLFDNEFSSRERVEVIFTSYYQFNDWSVLD